MAKIKIGYHYGRFGAGPGTGGNARCSNHHVLPYYVMEYVGLLWCALAREDDSYQAPLVTLVTLGTLNGMTAAMTKHGDEYIVGNNHQGFQQFASAFSWLPHNLFVGPSATYRISDPSQRIEPEKPASFPNNRWNQLNALWGQVRTCGNLPHSTGNNGHIEVTLAKAKDVINAARTAFTGTPTPWATKLSDWCASVDANTGRNANKRYRIDVVLKNDGQVNQLRTDDDSFSWAHLDVISDQTLEEDKHVRILQVKPTQVPSVRPGGAPANARNNAVFSTEFH